MAETAIQNPKFEIRHYEAIRRERLARGLGEISLGGVWEQELNELRRRRRVEVVDILAESLKPEGRDAERAAVSTHREFEYREGKIVAQDGEVIEELLERALRKDIEKASEDTFFAPFLPARSRHELDEHGENEAAARGETDYNTNIAFSPYGEEFDDGSEFAQSKLIEAAQKPYYKRAMLRLSHWDGARLHMFTRSVDNASVDLLREVAKRELDYEFDAQNSTDMLGERLHLTVDGDSAEELIDRLVGQADAILAERQGGEWLQGIRKNNYKEAVQYVNSQPVVVDSLINIGEELAAKQGNFEDYNAAIKEKIYDAIALLEKRLELGRESEEIEDYAAASSVAGAVARAEGRSYDACGMVISSAESNAETAGEQTGFESLLRLEGKSVTCPGCEKKVTVDKKYLQKGELYCKECGFHVDVCTGKTSVRKKPKQANSEPRFFEIISIELARYELERKARAERKRAA